MSSIAHPNLRLPENRRVYAVGDIHGRLDLLHEIEAKIASDIQLNPDLETTIVYLGDYVDRGPASADVIEHLSSNSIAGADSIHLRGNHEDFFLDYLSDRAYRLNWFPNGGVETFRSYGIDPSAVFDEDSARRAAAGLRHAMPATHLEFLNSLPTSYRIGDVFFAHAGVNPDRPLNDQRNADLMWIRDKFFDYDGDLGVLVVHGHTPIPEPEVSSNRIGIDTHAWHSGRLTAVVLENGAYRFLYT